VALGFKSERKDVRSDEMKRCIVEYVGKSFLIFEIHWISLKKDGC